MAHVDVLPSSMIHEEVIDLKTYLISDHLFIHSFIFRNRFILDRVVVDSESIPGTLDVR